MEVYEESPSKRRRKSSDNNCIICRHLGPLDADSHLVTTPTLEGMKAVIHAAEIRQDDVYETLVEIKDNILDGTVVITYHKKCRAWYTSASNLKYVRNVPTTSTSANVLVSQRDFDEQRQLLSTSELTVSSVVHRTLGKKS